jgi:hypothetical protein
MFLEAGPCEEARRKERGREKERKEERGKVREEERSRGRGLVGRKTDCEQKQKRSPTSSVWSQFCASSISPTIKLDRSDDSGPKIRGKRDAGTYRRQRNVS